MNKRLGVNSGWAGLWGKPKRRTMAHTGPRTTSKLGQADQFVIRIFWKGPAVV